MLPAAIAGPVMGDGAENEVAKPRFAPPRLRYARVEMPLAELLRGDFFLNAVKEGVFGDLDGGDLITA